MSKQFCEQVDQENIVGPGEEYVNKHVLKVFDYSIDEYLERIDENMNLSAMQERKRQLGFYF